MIYYATTKKTSRVFYSIDSGKTWGPNDQLSVDHCTVISGITVSCVLSNGQEVGGYQAAKLGEMPNRNLGLLMNASEYIGYTKTVIYTNGKLLSSFVTEDGIVDDHNHQNYEFSPSIYVVKDQQIITGFPVVPLQKVTDVVLYYFSKETVKMYASFDHGDWSSEPILSTASTFAGYQEFHVKATSEITASFVVNGFVGMPTLD